MLRVVGIGSMIGLRLSFAGGVLTRGLLYGVAAFHLWTFALATSLLAGTAVLAAVLPAGRAGRAELATLLKERRCTGRRRPNPWEGYEPHGLGRCLEPPASVAE